METKKASIKRMENSTQLILEVGIQRLNIILTDDNPNNVKTVFNSLLKELKKSIFEFKLEDDVEDLYHHICTEYITQLNSEMKTVYQELSDYELVDQTTEGKK